MADEPEAPATGGADVRSPEDWQRLTFPTSELGRTAPDSWKHAAAANLHGWTAHAYHQGEPLQLSRADYDAALTAAVTLVPVEGAEGVMTYAPHPAALSPHLRQTTPGKDEEDEDEADSDDQDDDAAREAERDAALRDDPDAVGKER